MGEMTLIGPDLVFYSMEKIRLIRERLMATQSYQKSSLNVTKCDLEFNMDD